MADDPLLERLLQQTKPADDPLLAKLQPPAAAAPPPTDEFRLSQARKAAGPGASEQEVREAAARMPPPPERGGFERVMRGEGIAAQGAQYGIADTLGALPDLVARGTNAIGLTNIKPGQYADWARQGMKMGGLIPTMTPENRTEEVAQGIGHGAGEAAASVATGGLLSGATRAGTVAHGVGEAMQAAPAMQLASGAVGGGVTGATDNPWLGLLSGVSVPAGVALARKLTAPAVRQLSDFGQGVMDRARNVEGVQTSAAEHTGSPTLRTLEDTFGQLATTAGPQAAVNRAKQDSFNRAVLGHSDTGGTSAEPGVLNQRLATEGGNIGNIAARTPVDPHAPIPTGAPPAAPGQQPPTTTLAQQLQDLGDEARRLATEPRPVINQIHSLVQHIDPATGTIPGSFVREWDTRTRTLAEGYAASHPDLARRLREVQDTVRDAHMAGMSQQDAAAYLQSRRNYGVLKTTEDAVGGAGKAAAQGDVPPLALRGAVENATNLGYARGGSDLNDLARAGQLMRPPPDSGTAMRTMMIGLLQGGAGAVPGYAAGGLQGAALGAAGTLGLPRAAQWAYNHPLGQQYIEQGIPALHSRLPQQSGLSSILAERLMDAQRQQRQQ